MGSRTLFLLALLVTLLAGCITIAGALPQDYYDPYDYNYDYDDVESLEAVEYEADNRREYNYEKEQAEDQIIYAEEQIEDEIYDDQVPTEEDQYDGDGGHEIVDKEDDGYGSDSYHEEASHVEDSISEESDESEEYFLRDTVCSHSCPSTSYGPKFMVNQEYHYRYEGHVSGKTWDGGKEESRVTYRANVVISPNTSPCDLRMKMFDVQVDEISAVESDWFRKSLEQYELHFSYHDAEVKSICPHVQEEVAATNFKRGILSNIHLSVPEVYNPQTFSNGDIVVEEPDVTGDCETRYFPDQEDGSIVHKKKESCRAHMYLPNIPGVSKSQKHSDMKLPINSRNHTCRMQLRTGQEYYNNPWKYTECEEQIQVERMTSLGEKQNIAYYTIFSSLTLGAEQQQSQVFQRDYEKRIRRSIKMDLEDTLKSFENSKSESEHNLKKSEKIIDLLEQITESEDDMETLRNRPKLFSQLIDHLDQMQPEDRLNQLFGLDHTKTQRDFLKDGIMACRSYSCIRFVTGERELFTEPQLSTWLKGLHFHTNPTPEDISTVMELAELEWNLRSNALLTASSMVWQRCQKHPETCHHDAEPFLFYVESVIDKQCSYDDDKTWANIKLVLRALGNAGTLPDHSFPERCYRNKLACPEIRDAALQAYRKTSCPDYKTAMEILRDRLDDVDVRIAAYLSLVPCVKEHPYFFKDIQDLLEQEDVNQVGSFIWTHANNLVHSANVGVDSEKLSKFASAYHLKNKWDTNAWKSSRNYRMDQFNEQMNIGSLMDTDIIFTPESYLPFQAKANFTIDMFDKSFNMFEIGGTFKRFENYVDDLLSNNDYFNNEVLENIMKSLKSKKEVNNEKLEEYQRIYNEVHNTKDEEDSAPRASIFIRVFGREIVYNENLMKEDPLKYFLSILDQVSNSNNYHKIFNEEIVTPTILGLPLTFKIDAVGSLSMEKTWNQDRFSISGSISPKAVLSVEESVTVNGYGAKSAIKRKTTYAANAKMGVDINMENSFDIKFNVPESNLISVSKDYSIELYQSSDMKWEEEAEYLRDGESYCSESHPITRMLGLAFCSSSEVSVKENNGQEIHENLSWGYYIKKTDTFDHYRLAVEIKEYGNYHFLMDTPGSSINRKIEIQGSATGEIKDKLEIEGLVNFPYPEINFNSIIGITNNENKFEFKFEMHQSSQELATFGVTAEHSNKVSETEITAYFRVPESIDMSYEGNIRKDFTSKDKNFIGIEGQFSSSTVDEPLKIEAYGESEKEKIATKVVLDYGSFKTTVNTEAEFSDDKILFGVRSEYGTDGRMENYEIFFMNENTFEEDHAVVVGDFKLQVSTFNGFNIDGGYRLHPFSKELNINSNIQGVQKNGRLVSKDRFEDNNRDFQVTFEFSDPNQEEKYVAHLLYKTTENALQAEIEASYGSSFYWKSSASYLLENDPLHYLVGLHIQLNDFVMRASNNIDLSQDNHLAFSIGGQFGPAYSNVIFDIDYDYSRPLNATFNAGFGYGSKWSGVTHSTTSNDDWTMTDGTTEISWFDFTYKSYHQFHWSEDNKYVKFTDEDKMSLYIALTNESPLKTMLQISADDKKEESDPYQWSLILMNEVTKEETSRYELMATKYETQKLFAFLDIDGDSFKANWKYNELGESDGDELFIDGHYNIRNIDNMEISANIELKVASGSYQSDLNARTSYDGVVRDVMVSGTYGGEIIESQIKIINDDGWFKEYHRGFIINFKSPFERMNSFKFEYEFSSDPKQNDYIEVEWEKFKVLGSLRTGDWNDFEAKIEYQDDASEDSSCNSYLQMTHHFNGQHYETAAIFDWSLSSPWEIRVNIKPNDDELIIGLYAIAPYPVATTALTGELIYGLREDEFKFICSFETEQPKEFLISITGNYIDEDDYGISNRRKGELIFNIPGLQLPITFNINHYQDFDKFDTKADLRGHSFESVEFSSHGNYSSNGALKVSLQLASGENQVLFEAENNLYKENVVQELEFSINTFRLLYNLDSEWGDNDIPRTAQGKVTISNLFGSEIDCTFNHKTESKTHETSFFGSLDEIIIQATHTLEYNSPSEWDSEFSFYVPEDGLIGTKISVKGKEDLSAIDIDMTLSSPWTNDVNVMYKKTFSEDLYHQNIEVYHHIENLFSIHVTHSDLLSILDGFNLEIDVLSPLFDDINVKWMHELKSTFTDTNYMYDIDLKYGSSLYIKSKHKFQYYKNIWNILPNIEKFTHYEMETSFAMPNSDVAFSTHFSVDINNPSTKFYFNFNENVMSIYISPTKGFEGLLKSYYFTYQIDILLKENIIPNVYIYGRNEDKFIKLNSTVDSMYPEFISTSLYDFNGNAGELKVHIDMDENFDDYTEDEKAINANFDFNSNYEMVESLNLDFTYIRKYTEEMEFHDQISGTVKLNEIEVYGGNLETTLKSKDNDFKISLKGYVFSESEEYGVSMGCRALYKEDIDLSMDMSYTYDDNTKGFDARLNISPNYNTSLNVNLHDKVSASSFIFEFDFENVKIHLQLKPTKEYYYDFSAEQDGSKLMVKFVQVNHDVVYYTFIEGKVSWVFKQNRKQFIVNLSSDFDLISKINGQISVQSKRGNAAEIKLKINKKTFNANIRHISRKPGFNGKVTLKVKNNFHIPFQSDITLVMNSGNGESKSTLTIDLDGKKKWLVANISLTLQELKVKINRLFELENMNFTLTHMWEEKMSIMMKAEYSLQNEDATIMVDIGMAKNFMDANFIIESDYINSHLLYSIGDSIYANGFTLPKSFELKCDLDSLYLGIEDKLINFHTSFLTDYDLQMDFNQKFWILYLADFEYNIKYSYENTSESEFSHSFTSELYGLFGKEEPLSSFSVTGSRENYRIEWKGVNPLDDSEFRFTLENEMRFDGQEIPSMINTYYDQRIFEEDFKMSLSNEIIITDKEIHFQSNFVSDFEIMSYADMSGTYRYDDSTFEFLFNTPQGNTKGSGQFEFLVTGGSFTAEMTSDHHKFKKYKLEGSYFKDEEELTINWLSSQDEKDFNFKLSVKPQGYSNYLNLYIQTPFRGFDKFELILKLERGDQPYKGSVSIALFDRRFEMEVLHEHGRSWNYQETNVLLTLPYDANQINLKFMYDIESLHTELYYEKTQDKFGVEVKIYDMIDTFDIKIKTDVTLFDYGLFQTIIAIPMNNDEQLTPYRFEIIRTLSNLNGKCYILVQPDIHSGTIDFEYDHPIFGYSDLNLNGSYEFFNGNDKNTLTLMGKFNELEASAKIHIDQNEWGFNPLLIGSVMINTNIPKYEVINGKWNISIYDFYSEFNSVVDLSLEIDGMGTTSLRIQNLQYPYSHAFLIRFSSPFTHNHEIEFGTKNIGIYIEYKHNNYDYGASLSIQNPINFEENKVVIKGITPFRYISKFDIQCNYDFTKSIDMSIDMNYEGAILKSSVFYDGYQNVGKLDFEFTSPFTNPLTIKMHWDSSKNILKCSINIPSFEFEFSNEESDLKLFFKFPVGESDKLNFNVLYDFKDPNLKKLVGSTILGDNYVSFEFVIEDVKGSEKGIDVHGNGNMNFYGTKGSMEFQSKLLRTGHYSASITFKNDKSENIFYGQINFSDIDFEIRISYMTQEILKITCDSRDIIAVDLYISPDKNYFLALYFSLTEQNNDYKVSFNIDTSDSEAFDLQARVSPSKKGGETIATLKIGNKEYVIEGNIDASQIRSEFSLMFKSSEDIYHPLDIKVKYDIKDFLKGKMKSMQEIGHASITWKDTLKFSVLGMQNGNRAKVTFDLQTPFRQLPKFSFGYDGEFLFKPKKIDFTYTIFAEWSERISLSNSFLYKDQDQQINLSFIIKTPFKDFENATITLKKGPSDAVFSTLINSELWKFSYKFIENGVDVLIQTPKLYELIMFGNILNPGVSGTMILKYQGSEIFSSKLHAELWKLEISIESQWELLQTFKLRSELQTESEELMFKNELHYNLVANTFTFIMAPQRYNVDIIHLINEDEIGKLSFNYKEKGRTFEVTISAKTPFQAFTNINGEIAYTPKKTTGAFTIQEKTANLKFIETKSDYILSIDESLFGNNSLEVKAPLTLKSMKGNADFEFPFEYGEFAVTFGYNTNEEDNYEGELYIQQISDLPFNLRIILNLENNEENRKIKMLYSTENALKYDFNDYEVEIGLEHGKDMMSVNAWSSAMHLDTASKVYGFDISFNLNNSMFNFELTMSDSIWTNKKYASHIFYDFENNMKLVFKIDNDLPLLLEWKYIDDEWIMNITVFDFKNELILTLLDPNLENLTGSVTLMSDFLIEGMVELAFEFRVYDIFHYTVDINSSYGNDDWYTNVKINYNEKMQNLEFEVKFSSSWSEEYAINLNVKMMRVYSFELILKAMEETHIFRMKFNPDNKSMDMDIDSSFSKLPFKNFSFQASEKSVKPIYEIKGSSIKVDFKGSAIMDIDGEKNNADIILQFDTDFSNLNSILRNTNFLFKIDEDDNSFRIAAQSSHSSEFVYHINIDSTYNGSEQLFSSTLGLRSSWSPGIIFNINFPYLHKSPLIDLSVEIEYGSIFVDLTKAHLDIMDFNVFLVDASITDDIIKINTNIAEVFDSLIQFRKYNENVTLGIHEIVAFIIRVETPIKNWKIMEFSVDIPLTLEENRFSVAGQWNELYFDISAFYELTAEKIYFESGLTYKEAFNKPLIYSFHIEQEMEDNQVMIVYISYPGKKIGIEYKWTGSFSDFMKPCNKLDDDAIFIFRVNLPFEKYDIISIEQSIPSYCMVGNKEFKYVASITPLKSEIRIGSVGYSFSINTENEPLVYIYEVLFNDYKIEGRLASLFNNVYRAMNLQITSEPALFMPINVNLDIDKKIQLEVKQNSVDLLRMFLSWEDAYGFGLTFNDAVFPLNLIINIESTDELNDYHIEYSWWEDKEMGLGIHLHQNLLDDGRHIAFDVMILENSFGVDMTLAYSRHTFNDILVLNYNKNRIGYHVFFDYNTNYLEDVYTGDVKLIMFDRTVQWKHLSVAKLGTLSSSTEFHWNNRNQYELPLRLQFDYSDRSFFGFDNHYFICVFKHPEIENLILEGNITEAINGTQQISVMFDDLNIPNREIFLRVEAHPFMDNGEHHIVFFLNQPFSGFATHAEVNFNKEMCHIATKYWSLTQEKWLHMDIDSYYDSKLHFEIFSNDKYYGYALLGNMNVEESGVGMTLEGHSKESGNRWELGMNMETFLPQLIIIMSANEKAFNSTEAQRFRVGLQNPREMGVYLDYKTFSGWQPEAEASIKLETSEILKFQMKYDQTKDVLTNLKHLVANRLYEPWKHDISRTFNGIDSWFTKEMIPALDVLFSRQTVKTILIAENRNFEMFVNDFNWLLGTTQRGIVATFDALFDVIQEGYNIIEPETRQFIYELYHLQEIIGNKLIGAFYPVTHAWDEFKIFWADRVQEDIDIFIEEIQESFNEITTLLSEVYQDIMYQMVRWINTALLQVREPLKEVYGDILEWFYEWENKFNTYINDTKNNLLNICWSTINSAVEELQRTLSQRNMQPIREFLRFDYVSKHFYESTLYIELFLESFASTIKDGIRNLQDEINSTPIFDSASLDAIVQSIKEKGFMGVAKESMVRAQQNISLGIEESLHWLMLLLNQLDKFGPILDESGIFLDFGNAATANSRQRLSSSINLWLNEQGAKADAVQTLVQLIYKIMQNIFGDKEEFIRQSIIFEPHERGLLMYRQYLPMSWNSFLQTPDLEQFTGIFVQASPVSAAKHALEIGFDNARLSQEALTNPSFNSFLMPFSSIATIAGQHITTFDQKHYQFLGPCSYLLTRDFVNEEFTITVHYEQNPNGQIQLHSINFAIIGNEVDIFMNGELSFKNDNTKSLFEVEKDQIDDIGHYRLTVRPSPAEFIGAMVTCNTYTKVCTVMVTGKYFGRLGGLFGNFNNEPSDDFQGPDGSRYSDPALLANAWSVNMEPCLITNQAVQVDKSELKSKSDVDTCQRLFLHLDSPLASCFGAIDPRPYFWHCMSAVNRPHYGMEEDMLPCIAVASYNAHCSREGVTLPQLNQCQHTVDEEIGKIDLIKKKETVLITKPRSKTKTKIEPAGTCLHSDGITVSQGWSEEVQQNEMKENAADIALIIEDAKCFKGKDFARLVNILRGSMKRVTRTDVKYFFTSNSNSVNKMLSEEKYLPVDHDVITEYLSAMTLGLPKSSDGGASILMDSLKKFQWRHGVSRNAILISCGTCQPSTPTELSELLHEYDIKLHLLTKVKPVVNGPSPKKSAAMSGKVLGFDEEFVYTPADFNKFKGNKKLFGMMEAVDDVCVKAAVESGGSVFNHVKWTQNPTSSKKFVRIFTTRVALSIITPSCHRCTCIGEMEEMPLLCRSCDTTYHQDIINAGPQAPRISSDYDDYDDVEYEDEIEDEDNHEDYDENDKDPNVFNDKNIEDGIIEDFKNNFVINYQNGKYLDQLFDSENERGSQNSDDNEDSVGYNAYVEPENESETQNSEHNYGHEEQSYNYGNDRQVSSYGNDGQTYNSENERRTYDNGNERQSYNYGNEGQSYNYGNEGQSYNYENEGQSYNYGNEGQVYENQNYNHENQNHDYDNQNQYYPRQNPNYNHDTNSQGNNYGSDSQSHYDGHDNNNHNYQSMDSDYRHYE